MSKWRAILHTHFFNVYIMAFWLELIMDNFYFKIRNDEFSAFEDRELIESNLCQILHLLWFNLLADDQSLNLSWKFSDCLKLGCLPIMWLWVVAYIIHSKLPLKILQSLYFHTVWSFLNRLNRLIICENFRSFSEFVMMRLIFNL